MHNILYSESTAHALPVLHALHECMNINLFYLLHIANVQSPAIPAYAYEYTHVEIQCRYNA